MSKKKQESAAECKAESQTPDNLSDGENDEEEYYDGAIANGVKLLTVDGDVAPGSEIG